MHHNSISKSAAMGFSDLPPEEGEALIKQSPPHSAISFAGELTHAGYKYIPVSWLLCENDLAITAKNQRDAIAMIERDSGKKVHVTSIGSGHMPIASRYLPEVIDWVIDVAQKAQTAK